MCLINKILLNVFVNNQLTLADNLKYLDPLLLGWIAGFVDGDGHIGCRIIKRKDYKFGFKLTPEVSFTQKDVRGKHLFPHLQKLFINVGGVRITKDNVMRYEIQGRQDVGALVQTLLPYLVLKQKQAKYCLDIVNSYEQAMQDPKLFLELCRRADRMSKLNDSRKDQRVVTSEVVAKHLKSKGLI